MLHPDSITHFLYISLSFTKTLVYIYLCNEATGNMLYESIIYMSTKENRHWLWKVWDKVFQQYCSNVMSPSLSLSTLTIANQRGVALALLVNIHPTRNEIKTGKQNRCHASSIGDYLSTRNRLTHECTTLHLSSTIYTCWKYVPILSNSKCV